MSVVPACDPTWSSPRRAYTSRADLPAPPWNPRRRHVVGPGNTSRYLPSKATAQSQLNALTVKSEGSTSGCSRDLFPRWITISGVCNTRETVLKHDDASVAATAAAPATSGRWYSPCNGATWTAASDVDIDHVVLLAEAWRSGASGWNTSRQQSIANDLTRPQVRSVHDP
ncbi:hypothetical protein [Micromonospora aurantiaca (nom. illeg.)]|uniref:hypothetical protein n=1 Tax=Micromonospora aurantiaca (nom. illeg.) TaxID=47850 RepID=UPI003796109F